MNEKVRVEAPAGGEVVVQDAWVEEAGVVMAVEDVMVAEAEMEAEEVDAEVVVVVEEEVVAAAGGEAEKVQVAKYAYSRSGKNINEF